jgi:MFS family permease
LAVRLKVALDPDGWIARIFLCFAATAGIVYVNIMPALVDALQAGLGFSIQEAGRIGSANTYGGALGAFTMAFIAPRLRWRRTLVVLTMALMAFDAGCLPLRGVSVMMVMRFMHGLVGGAMVGMAFFIIARNQNPGRTFGILMVLQFALSMGSLAVLPALVRLAGIEGVPTSKDRKRRPRYPHVWIASMRAGGGVVVPDRQYERHCIQREPGTGGRTVVELRERVAERFGICGFAWWNGGHVQLPAQPVFARR